jgi:methyl-accepting chemotaxis protein
MRRFTQGRYLLWDTVQPRFLAVSVAHQSLVFLTFAGSLFIPLMIKLHDTPLSSPEAGDIGTQFTILHDSVWPAFPIAIVLILVHSVFFSHRIAGPLYRFRNVFKAIGQGDLLVRTKIRDHDYLKPEAESIEEMVGELRSKFAEIKTDCHTLDELMRDLQLALQRNSLKEATEVTARLDQGVRHLIAHVQPFRVHSQPAAAAEPRDDVKAA